MQQLIHESLIFDQAHCHGFLAATGDLIDSACRIANVVETATLAGIYLKSDDQGQVDLKQAAQLQQQFIQLTGRQPAYYLLLQNSTKGRTDALLFADAACSQTMKLEMLEDGDLYPVPSSR